MASCTPSTTSRAQSFASAGPISRHLLCHLHRHRTPVRAAVSSRAAAPPPRLGPRPPLVLLRHPRLPELVAWPTMSTVTLFSASAFHLHPSSAPPPRLLRARLLVRTISPHPLPPRRAAPPPPASALAPLWSLRHCCTRSSRGGDAATTQRHSTPPSQVLPHRATLQSPAVTKLHASCCRTRALPTGRSSRDMISPMLSTRPVSSSIYRLPGLAPARGLLVVAHPPPSRRLPISASSRSHSPLRYCRTRTLLVFPPLRLHAPLSLRVALSWLLRTFSPASHFCILTATPPHALLPHVLPSSPPLSPRLSSELGCLSSVVSLLSSLLFSFLSAARVTSSGNVIGPRFGPVGRGAFAAWSSAVPSVCPSARAESSCLPCVIMRACGSLHASSCVLAARDLRHPASSCVLAAELPAVLPPALPAVGPACRASCACLLPVSACRASPCCGLWGGIPCSWRGRGIPLFLRRWRVFLAAA